MFLSLDGTFWIQLINFAVFYLILELVFLRVVRRAIIARRAHIDSIQSEYTAALHDLAAVKAHGEQQKLANRRAIEEYFAQMRAEANDEAALITARATALANDRVAKAQAIVAEEIDAASQRMDTLADELASSLLGRVLEKA